MSNYSGILNLKAFTRHAWRNGARTSVAGLATACGTISEFGLLPDIRFAIRDVLVTQIGTHEPGITGQDFARLADYPTYRGCTSEDVSKITSRALAAGDVWGEAAAIASLSEACELGYTAIAGAWGFGLLCAARPDWDGSLPETGLPVPADDIALLLMGCDLDTRRPNRGTPAWRDAVRKANSTAQNTVLLSFAAANRNPVDERSRREQAEIVAELLDGMPWVSPRVSALLTSTFGTLIMRHSAAA